MVPPPPQKKKKNWVDGEFLAYAWHVSFLRREKKKKKGKKDGWITRKVLRVLLPIGPLIWLLTGGDGSFLAELKACLICDSGCITQKGLIRNLIYVTAFNWNQIHRNWQNWLLSIYQYPDKVKARWCPENIGTERGELKENTVTFIISVSM